MDIDDLAGAHAVVLGATGFLGSHLCDRLIAAGAQVTGVDNLLTGSADNVAHLMGHGGFRLIEYDIANYLHFDGDVDFILHFASPASPVDYLRWPIQTLKVGSLGTHRALGLAHAKSARLLLASTSEVYGDPKVNPQPETYWGNVNPVGPRGVYDEAKRFAEALCLAYHREHGVEVRIARIFNSILADEQVLYDDGTQLRRETAAELAERLGGAVDLWGYRVPAFDSHGRIVAAEATGFVGHPATGPCFQVDTRYGRTVRVTGDHSLFVEGPEGTPQPRPVVDLQVGDRIAIAGRVTVPERDRDSVSMVQVWDRASEDPWDLVVTAPGLGLLVWDHRAELLPLLQARRSAGANRQSTWALLVRLRDADSLPLGAFRHLGLALPDAPETRVRTRRSRTALPLTIQLTDELLWFLGLYVAAGCRFDEEAKSAFIRIRGERDVLRNAHKVIERDLGVHVVSGPDSRERTAAMTVHSTLLLTLLDDLGFRAGPTRIPGWVLGLPLSRLKWFVEGYREGGRVGSGQTFEQERRHGFSTTSEALKDDLVVALGRFGIVPSVRRYTTTFKQRTGDRRQPSWRLTVGNVSPWSPLEWDGAVVQHLSARRTGDLVWAQVTEIREVAPTALVYDFCVPGYENFWAGGVAAHNTFGPRMRRNDGRAVPAFFAAAWADKPLPIHGDGTQTRSLCYVDDEVEGLLRLMLSDHVGPVNIGNPEEVTMLQLAEMVQDVVGNHPGVEFHPRPTDDPTVRRPDTALAEQLLGWRAQVPLLEGLRRTADWFRPE